MKLLIVDDEVKLVELLTSYFKLQGYEVWGTGTGEEALILLQQHQPNVCLLDLELKGRLNGTDVLHEATRQWPKIRIVIVTGDDNVAPDQLQQLGAAAFCKKPVQLDELTQLVQRLSGS